MIEPESPRILLFFDNLVGEFQKVEYRLPHEFSQRLNRSKLPGLDRGIYQLCRLYLTRYAPNRNLSSEFIMVIKEKVRPPQ